MKRILYALLVSLTLGAGIAYAQSSSGCVYTATAVAIGYDAETLTVSSTVKALTSSKYLPATGGAAKFAIAAVETNALRYYDTGTVPTSSVGLPAAAGSTMLICGSWSLSQLQMIAQGSNATVQVAYYR